jgi:uncharacterized protein (DUF849 family)
MKNKAKSNADLVGVIVEVRKTIGRKVVPLGRPRKLMGMKGKEG